MMLRFFKLHVYVVRTETVLHKVLKLDVFEVIYEMFHILNCGFGIK